jgi:hypothetical protein
MSSNEEPRADVWFVKTSDTQAGVIVMFTDAGEEDPIGIYLYEPGADPAELDSVALNGVATEFEYAIVETLRQVDTWSGHLNCETHTVHTEEREFPGDAMLTRAQRDADVEAAIEEHDTLADNHEKLTEQARALLRAVRDEHEMFHGGTFPFCGETLCKTARAVNL